MKIALAFAAGMLVVIVWASMKSSRDKVTPESVAPVPEPMLTKPAFRPDLLPGLVGTDKTRASKLAAVETVITVPNLTTASRAAFAGSFSA